MIDLDLFFPTLVALAFRNGMGYRYLNVRVNSASDSCISCEKFVKFGPLTPELTWLICERLVWHCQKMGLFDLISMALLDRFSQSLHYMKAHYVQTMDLELLLICQGTLPWQPNNVAKMYQRWLIPLAVSALVLENELQYYGLAVRNICAYKI